MDNLNIDNNKIDAVDKNSYVPIWEKYALTIYEAAEYFNIGEHRLRQLVKENRYADFFLRCYKIVLLLFTFFDTI